MASLYGQPAGQLCPNVFKFPFVGDVGHPCRAALLQDDTAGLGFMSKQEPAAESQQMF